MSNTRHRNASGPFVIFDPGLGISGSLEISGLIGGHDDGTGAVIRTGINPGIQIATDTFVTGTLKVGANHRMSLTDNELDISSGDFTLDVAGNIEINADGGTITFKDGAEGVLGTITSAGFSGTATTVTLTDNEATNENNLITFVADGASSSGAQSLEMDGDLHYNPSTGTVTATTFAGALSGNATTATTATNVTITDNESTDEDNKVIFGAGAAGSGNIGLEADGDFTYNPSTGAVTATTFVGALSGNATTATSATTATTATSATTAGTVTTAAQTNITSVGTLTGLTVSGDIGLSGDGTQVSKLGMNNNTVFLQCTAGDNDVELLRVSNNSTTLNDFNFGFSLVYSGSGSGDDNTFQLMADNSDAGPRTPVWTAYNDGDFQIGASGAKVTTILDQDNMSSDSATALATQQSIKAYVDNEIAGVGGGASLTHITEGATNQSLVRIANNHGTLPSATTKKSILAIKCDGPTSQTHHAISIHESNSNAGWTIDIDSGSDLLFRDGANGYEMQNGRGSTDPIATSFTAQHRCTPTNSTEEYSFGLIVVADGTYNNFANDEEISKPTINQAIPKFSLSTIRNQKSVLGVISNKEDDEYRRTNIGSIVRFTEKPENDIRYHINSIGEGGIWVCNINGNLENGDYITTCEVPGLGMKQDSEMLCNYTVAKITQDCNFRINAANYDVEEFEFEGKTYRKAFVGCTYHCG